MQENEKVNNEKTKVSEDNDVTLTREDRVLFILVFVGLSLLGIVCECVLVPLSIILLYALFKVIVFIIKKIKKGILKMEKKRKIVNEDSEFSYENSFEGVKQFFKGLILILYMILSSRITTNILLGLIAWCILDKYLY